MLGLHELGLLLLMKPVQAGNSQPVSRDRLGDRLEVAQGWGEAVAFIFAAAMSSHGLISDSSSILFKF